MSVRRPACRHAAGVVVTRAWRVWAWPDHWQHAVRTAHSRYVWFEWEREEREGGRVVLVGLGVSTGGRVLVVVMAHAW